MALLTDLSQRAKSVRQLVIWLEKNGNYQALDILECKGKLILIRLVKKKKTKKNKNNGAYCGDVDAPATLFSIQFVCFYTISFLFTLLLCSSLKIK